MDSDKERFIELATRPLGENAELQLSAEAELRKSIEADMGKPGALAEAVRSLEIADRYPLRKRGWMLLVALTVVVSLPFLVHTVLQFKEFAKVRWLVSSGGSSEIEKSKIPNLTPQRKLLLFGDGGGPNEPEKWKPLWDSAPDNPAYLAEYAAGYFRYYQKLSPEILAAAEKLDPDNAWFPALAASGIAEGAVTKERAPYSSAKTPPKTPVWTINDGKRMDEALAAIHQFAGKTKFTAYQNELLRQRIPLFPPRRDVISQIPPLVYVSSMQTANIGLRKLYEVLAAGAQQRAASGDVAGFRQIVSDWQALVPLLGRNGDTMIDVLIARAVFNFPVQNFRDAARTLGLESEAQHFAEIHDRSLMEKDEREKRWKASPQAELVTQRASVLASLTLPVLVRQVKTPPRLTDDDLRPGRYADHAVLERFGSWAAFLLLGLCAAGAAAFRFHQRPLARKLSARMVDLLRPSDWVWMFVGGIIFPVVWYFVISRLTPFSAREWSARWTVFIQPGGQFGCMVLSMIVMTLQMASWRLAKRGAAIGLMTRFSWIGWLAAVAALAGVPAFGAILYIGMNAGYALAGIALSWLMLGASLNVFGRAGQALRRATLGRLVWPVWVFGMLVMVALVPYQYAEERRWIQQDRIYEISAEFPGPNRYEYDVTQVLRQELLESISLSER
ncbi:MAG: hypothetical protein ABIS50_24735 [Luteolibacter sp.]|uniref:hypothetical protein n=1 Tax=Luteolibacter sp. TaxID=1962973 RepID=UPI0032676CC2